MFKNLNKFNMGTKTKEKECKCICAGITILSWFILFIVCAIPYLQYINYTKTECNVTHIDYPVELPNATNEEFWISCKCGRSCQSLTPCITIYGFINSNSNTTINSTVNTIYKFKESPQNKRFDCTFQQKKCPEGENIIDRQNAVIEAKNTFEQYNNKTTDCYVDEFSEIVVLNNDYNYNYLIAFSVIALLMTCFCNYYICCI